MSGRLESIHVAPAAGEPIRSLAEARLIAGQGLEGDRYATGRGHWSATRRSGDQLTLIEREVLDEIEAAHGFGLAPGDTRRNLTTSGIRLDDLIGRRFRIGQVVCRGVRRCEPCSYLEGLLEKPVLYPLVHQGGIRVEVETSGPIRVGDAVELLGSEEAAPAV